MINVAPGDLLQFKGDRAGRLWDANLSKKEGMLTGQIVAFKEGDLALVICMCHSTQTIRWKNAVEAVARGRYGLLPYIEKWDKVLT